MIKIIHYGSHLIFDRFLNFNPLKNWRIYGVVYLEYTEINGGRYVGVVKSKMANFTCYYGSTIILGGYTFNRLGCNKII